MSELAQVLRHLVPVDDPNALVDASTGDDAAVYRLDQDRALVVTADFFTPIVDDPGDFGRIAAANALSDLYAMGARPLFGLNLVGFPRDLLDRGILEKILTGGGEICREAGIAVLGGHSIDDAEPKFGMVAVGRVHPERILGHDGARAGDVLVLTKPVGSGVVATAIKAGDAPTELVTEAISVMAALNAGAADAAREVGVHAATDVTGFGLLGHLRALLRASGVSATVESGAVPLLPGVEALVEAGHVPGGTRRNAEDLAADVAWSDGLRPTVRTLLCDAQTSGGLLLSLPAERAPALLDALASRSPAAVVVGRVAAGTPGHIAVV